MNFQMFKLDLEKSEEPEIKLPTSAGLSKKAKVFQKNIYFCFIDYANAFDCVDHNKLWKILKEKGISDHLGSITTNKASGGDGIPVELFQILKNDALKVLHSIMENSAVATGLEKVSFPSNPKESQCQKMLKLLHNCTHLTC